MPESKQSNPKDALGVMKVPFHAIPSKPLIEIGLAMLEGGRKYGTHNYRAIGVRMSTYYDACLRHVISWWEGEDIDKDSGMHHVIKAISTLIVLRDSMHMGNCEDDRGIRYPNGIDLIFFNKMAADIIAKYPNCVEPFLEINKAMEEPSNQLKTAEAYGIGEYTEPIESQESQDERADETAGLELEDENRCSHGTMEAEVGAFEDEPTALNRSDDPNLRIWYCQAPGCMSRGPRNNVGNTSHFCDAHAEMREWLYCLEPDCVSRGMPNTETSGDKIFLCYKHKDFDYAKSN